MGSLRAKSGYLSVFLSFECCYLQSDVVKFSSIEGSLFQQGLKPATTAICAYGALRHAQQSEVPYQNFVQVRSPADDVPALSWAQGLWFQVVAACCGSRGMAWGDPSIHLFYL